MATTYTLTGSLLDAGVPFVGDKALAWIALANVNALIDTTTDSLVVGRWPVATDGTGDLSEVLPSTASGAGYSPDGGFAFQLYIEYRDSAPYATRERFVSQPFTLTANSTLADVLGGTIELRSVSAAEWADFQAKYDEIKDVVATTAGVMAAVDADAGSDFRTQQDARLSAMIAHTLGVEVTVDIRDYATLKAAIAALPSTGGRVTIPVGRFPTGSWTGSDYMNKPNVKIVGEKMPRYSANADRLESGSVLYGRFIAFADGLEVDNVGFDMGKYVIDTHYGAATTTSADHPLGGTWDAFVFGNPIAPTLASRTNCHFNNLIGLTKFSQTLGHAILIEAVDGGTADNVTGCGATHAMVLKSKNMRVGRIAGYAASTNDVIIKADSYAACGNLTIDAIDCGRTPPGTTPWFTASFANAGLFLNPQTAQLSGIHIGRLRASGVAKVLSLDGAPSFAVTDVQIGSLYGDGSLGNMTHGIYLAVCKAHRIQIGDLIVNNATKGITWSTATAGDVSKHQLHIGSAQFTDMTTRAIEVLLYGRVRIDSLELATTPYAYYIDDNSRLMIGKANLVSVTTKFERTPPTLATGWANYGSGNAAFDVSLENYGVALKGLLLASSGVAAAVCTLPAYLQPPETRRFPGYLNVSSARQFAVVAVGSGGVAINENTAPASGNWLSVDGVTWQHY